MTQRLALLLLLVSVPAFCLAQKKGSPEKPKEACSMLTSAEIQAVQGEPVQESKPTTQPGRGLKTSQCLFRTATPSKSVSLALVLPDPANPSSNSPREFWHKQFSESKHPDKEEGRGEREGGQPRVVAKLGDEAYWVGTTFTGALYVLRGNSFLRISVGGVKDQAARLEKSKTLARAALKRL